MTNTPIFLCANLRGDSIRRDSFSKNFSDSCLFRFVESIDGRSWSDEQADSYCSEEMRSLRSHEQSKGKVWVGPAAIACALTHRDKLLAEASNYPLVACEDDITLSSDFIDLWKNKKVRERLSELDGIVLIHYMSRKRIYSSTPPVLDFGKYKIYKLDEPEIGSAACYFAPPPIARSIRIIQTPIRVTADHWGDMMRAGAFSEIYVVHPSPCSIAGMASSIGYGGYSGNSLIARLARRLKRIISRFRGDIFERLETR